MTERASYFPVSRAALKMVAGLKRLGTDFGQGARDRQFFQVDTQREAYLRAKRCVPCDRHVIDGDDLEAVTARAAALEFMRATLHQEYPDVLAEADADAHARDGFEALARAVQEDFAVLAAGSRPGGRIVALDVRFPSGWRPERLGGLSFGAIHEPVPGLLANDAAARSMTRAMVERGPYVRFVWTLSADDRLDHHPDTHARTPWGAAQTLFLRVERQVTAPLPAACASVFLIRTYHYAAHELSREQRDDLCEALRVIPPEVRSYKNLPEAALVEDLLARL
jgi:dimethylamine monooxygenase subunit A